MLQQVNSDFKIAVLTTAALTTSVLATSVLATSVLTRIEIDKSSFRNLCRFNFVKLS